LYRFVRCSSVAASPRRTFVKVGGISPPSALIWINPHPAQWAKARVKSGAAAAAPEY